MAVIVYVITAWWLMETILILCDTTLLPADSPWRCPMDNVFFDASIIWGLIGTRRIFGDLGAYSNINWFFLLGAVAPQLVWIMHKAFPEKRWIRFIHTAVFLGSTEMMPPASAVNFTSLIIVGFISGFVIFRYKPKLWEQYNYVVSGGLDVGTAFMTILILLTLMQELKRMWD